MQSVANMAFKPCGVMLNDFSSNYSYRFFSVTIENTVLSVAPFRPILTFCHLTDSLSLSTVFLSL
jgi:hypothetical protein